jgi:hypothetical protein
VLLLLSSLYAIETEQNSFEFVLEVVCLMVQYPFNSLRIIVQRETIYSFALFFCNIEEEKNGFLHETAAQQEGICIIYGRGRHRIDHL